MKIGEVVVTEKSDYLTTADAPASVDVIGSDQIEMENVDFSIELMKKVPGTYFGDWNQGVVSGTFSMRGFDTNHDVPATLIADGIPHNFGYGRMDIQPFFPLEIDRIEVVKGTGDPRYGLQNIAGDVNIHSIRGGNFSQTRLLTGSYNTYDAGLIAGRDDGLITKPVGQRLEIVPLINPAKVKVQDKFPMQVLCDGKPANAINVEATFAGFSDRDYKAFQGKTNMKGLIDFIPLKHGYWVAQAKQTFEHPDKIRADEVVLVSTLTFKIKGEM
jgi:hypothetical protein